MQDKEQPKSLPPNLFPLPKVLMSVDIPDWILDDWIPAQFHNWEIVAGVRAEVTTRIYRKLGGGKVVKFLPVLDREPIPENIKCKACKSDKLVRFGTYKGTQRYRCRECKVTFMGKDTLPYMRVSIPVVADAVSLFYEGLSLNAIRRQLRQTHDIYPSDSNVYYWIVRFTKQAIQAAEGVTARTGNLWAADETMLKVAGGKTKEGLDNTIWYWDVIDEKTKFLLASHMSLTRTIKDAEILFKMARNRSKTVPRMIITDKLAAYIDGIEKVFGADATHIQSKGMRSSTHNNVIERFHGTIKQRTKVMRGLKSRPTAKLIMDGWLVHYNFFRPHEGLENKTPGEAAGVKFPYRGWKDVVREGVGNE